MPTPQDWQQTAEQWVPAFMAEHPEITNVDDLYAQMRESDMYVPRSYVRDEWRGRKQETEYMDIVERMEDTNVIPIGWMRPTSMEYKERYIWKVGITGIDAETGRAVDRMVTIESDVNETLDTILDAGWGWAAQYGLDLYASPPTIGVSEAMIRA